MKKIIALCLTFALMLSFISVNGLTASAAPKISKEVFSYKDDIIHIYRERTSFLSWYKYRLVLKTSENTYSTDWCITFSKTPLTVREICNKDKALRKAGAFTEIEKLYHSDQLLTNTREYLKGKILTEFLEEVEQKSKEACNEALVSAVKTTLGLETSPADFVKSCNDAVDTHDYYKSVYFNLFEYLTALWQVPTQNFGFGEGDVVAKYQDIRNESAENLINIINSLPAEK